MLNELKTVFSSDDPYEFFVSLYHIALENEERIINLKHSVHKHSVLKLFRDDVHKLAVSDNMDTFIFSHNAFNVYSQKVNDDDSALLFLIALIEKIDRCIAGVPDEENVEEKNLFQADPVRRLNSEYYYRPTSIVGNPGISYIITPNIEPAYFPWIKKESEISREPEYYSKTITHCVLVHHNIIPGDSKIDHNTVSFVHGSSSRILTILNENLQDIITSKKFTIGLAPYDEGFNFDPEVFSSRAGKLPFRYRRILLPTRKKIEKTIENILINSIEYGVDILLFPELTVDEEALQFFITTLRSGDYQAIKLIIAGSFHEVVGPEEPEEYVNRAVVLDSFGNRIWEYKKKTPFEIKKEEITEPVKVLFPGSGDMNIVENIRTDSPFIFFDSPIGRISVLICLDYLNAGVGTILSRMNCGYFFVPAMTPSIKDFKTHASSGYGGKFHILSSICASKSICELMRCQQEDYCFLYAASKKFGKPITPIKVDKVPLLIYKLHELI